MSTLATRWRALRALWRLQPRDVDAFLAAYVLFDGDWSNDNGKRESHIVDYYRVLNHLCALGNVEKMYIPPVRDPAAGVFANQLVFEREMVDELRIPPGGRVLDVGCGRGRVAAHVAERSGAHVAGLNLDPSQVANARENAVARGLSCAFEVGSLNDPLPFDDGSFDAGYQIQAFTYARDKQAVFAEIRRVLRPGARFSYLDWVRLPAFDPTNADHAALLRRTQGIIGAVDTPSPPSVEAAMVDAGLRIVRSGDASVGGHQSELIAAEDRYFRAARRGVQVGVAARLLPRHFLTLFDRFVKDAEAFVTMDRLGLATSSWQIVAERPAA